MSGGRVEGTESDTYHMKTILTLLTILGAQFIAAPEAEARPQQSCHRYVTSRTSCGCPIYTQRYISHYDRCGHPVYRYRTERIVHRCRPVHRHPQPVYRQSYYSGSKRKAIVSPRCGTSSSRNRTTYRRPTIYGFPR